MTLASRGLFVLCLWAASAAPHRAVAAPLADVCGFAPRTGVETIMRTPLVETSFPEAHVCTFRSNGAPGGRRQVFLSAWSYATLATARAAFRSRVAANARLMHAGARDLAGYGDEAASVPSFAFVRTRRAVFEVHASDPVTPAEVPVETKRLLRLVLARTR